MPSALQATNASQCCWEMSWLEKRSVGALWGLGLGVAHGCLLALICVKAYIGSSLAQAPICDTRIVCESWRSLIDETDGYKRVDAGEALQQIDGDYGCCAVGLMWEVLTLCKAKEYDGRLLTMVLLLQKNVWCVRLQQVLNVHMLRRSNFYKSFK